MPLPVYQRPLGCLEWSTFTAMTLSSPTGFNFPVKSTLNEL